MSKRGDAAKRAKLAADAAAWAANVMSSVLIIFVNKALMGSAGYGFAFGALSRGESVRGAVSCMYGVGAEHRPGRPGEMGAARGAHASPTQTLHWHGHWLHR